MIWSLDKQTTTNKSGFFLVFLNPGICLLNSIKKKAALRVQSSRISEFRKGLNLEKKKKKKTYVGGQGYEER